MATKNVGRILTNEEVREMLIRDAKKDDQMVSSIKRDWQEALKACLWTRSCGISMDRIQVEVCKCDNEYVFCNKKTEVRIDCELVNSNDFWLNSKPTTEGLSMYDIEDLLGKVESQGVIKVLLDAGFTLDLIVLKQLLQ